jgi:hypothetical protein
MATPIEPFLQEKAHNFEAYLRRYQPGPELEAFMARFDPATLLSSIRLWLLPARAALTSKGIAERVMADLTVPPAEVEAVRSRITRYIDMFADVITGG